MSESTDARRRITPSLVISVLALTISLSGTAYALGKGEVKARHLAKNSVTKAKIAKGAVVGKKLGAGAVTADKLADAAVIGPKLAPNAVTGGAVAPGSLRLSDLGTSRADLTNQTFVVAAPITPPDNGCEAIFLRLINPAPNGVAGSMVTGYITDPQGGAAIPNALAVVPTMMSETNQGGIIANLLVCSSFPGSSVPVGSIVHWSVVGP